MLKVTVTGVRMRVRARYRVTGSVLSDSVMAAMVGAETTLEIDSPDASERVARVVRNAERGCFVMQALLNPRAGLEPDGPQRPAARVALSSPLALSSCAP